MEIQNDERFLKIPEVSSRVGMGRTKIYELIREGSFPAPVKIGTSSLWPNSSITEWIQKVMRENVK